MKTLKEIQEKLSKEIKAKQIIEKELKLTTIALHKAHNQIQQLTNVSAQQEFYHKSELRYEKMMENMELGIMEVDNNEMIIKAYPMFCKMVGYTEKELIGKKALDLFVPEGLDTYYNEKTSNRVKGQTSTYEMQILTKKKEKIWVIISGVPMFDNDGKTIGDRKSVV